MYPRTYNANFSRRTVTRPTNTTPYVIGGVITELTPANIVFPVSLLIRAGYLYDAQLVTNNPAHTGAIRLWLFDTTFTVPADGTVLALSAAVGATCEGYVDFTTFNTPGSSLFAYSAATLPANNRAEGFQPGVDNNLYGVLEARSAFTPTSGQTFTINLYSEVSA